MMADTTDILVDRFRRHGIRRVLDVGCGIGGVAKRLTELGFSVVGVDPSREAIEKARQAAPKARFEIAAAESLPFPAGSFDVVLFHNSFHHIAPDCMGRALNEATRALHQDGYIMIVEPVAEGTLFETVRPVEDETLVRAMAEKSIRAAVATGNFDLVETVLYERDELFPDVQQFLDHLLRVDASRAAAIERERTHVGRLFEANGSKGDAGYYFRQPQTLYILQSA